MDCNTEEPPTSIIPPVESNFSQVIFPDVQKFYPPKTDLQCKFCKEKTFNCNPKDWIGIFKVGWKTTRDYYTWISARSSVDNMVLFAAYYVPRDDEYYQFCYVDLNGQVRGASIPFQIRLNTSEDEDDEDDILMVTTELEMKKIEENAELKKMVEKLTAESSELQEKVSSLQNEKQAQAEKIQNLQDEQLSATEKMQRLEAETMEQTVQIKNLMDENEMMKQNMQSMDIDLQMYRNQEERLLSEVKAMQISKDNMQEEKKHFEKMQIHMKTLKEEKEKLESELKLYKEKELKFVSDKEELEKSLEKSVAEKCQLQSEDLAKQKVVESLTSTANQCKEQNVTLRAELELQTCSLEREKKQKETLKQSLDKEIKKVLDLEHNMKQKTEKLKSEEEKRTSLSKQVDGLQVEKDNNMKQMGILHLTIANLEGEVKRMKNECKNKMEAERTVRELRTQVGSSEEALRSMEGRLAQQQDACRLQGEDVIALQTTVELREVEIQDLKDVLRRNRIEIDDLNSRLIARAPAAARPPNPALMFGNPYEDSPPGFSMAFGSMTSPTSRRPSSPLNCPMCPATFQPHERQLLEEHVNCHFDADEAP